MTNRLHGISRGNLLAANQSSIGNDTSQNSINDDSSVTEFEDNNPNTNQSFMRKGSWISGESTNNTKNR